MIHDALQLLVNDLNNALKGSGNVDPVYLGNIAQVEGGSSDAEQQVVLSLVNVEEETTLKNGPHHRIRDSRVQYQNRPINIYLYLLFSANNKDYGTALKRLESIIIYLQGKNIFTARNSASLNGLSRSAEELAGFRLTLDLYSLSFEQINHLWGSLGGKQVPFVLYRARLISLEANEILSTGAAITDISLSSGHL